MALAAAWSAVATATLLVGMALSYRNLVSLRGTGLFMAFGAGAIVSAVAYQLILAPVIESPADTAFIGIGLAAGALTFYVADRWVDSLGGEHRMSMQGKQSEGSGTAILLGSLLDGVPESLVLGLSLAHSPTISIAFVFAVAISNVPQGLGGTSGMLAAGWPRSRITRLWIAVCVASIAAAVLGYILGSAFAGLTGGVVDAFAAGALLVMLTDSMIPEAFEHGGRETGLALVFGFVVASVMALAQAGI
jgi:ZIP family zinc transporter